MNSTQKTLNILLVTAIITGDILYLINGGLLTKGLTSSLFVVMGLINLLYTIQNNGNIRFAITMVTGLFFAMLGDIVLNLYFIGGAALFAIGHIFYFIAYCKICSYKKSDLIPAVFIFVPSALLLIFAPFFDFGGIIMQLVCIVYAAIISCMLGKSYSNYHKNKSLLRRLLFIGSILFYFSDFMLVFNVFADAPRIIDILCLASYYPAQCFLAASISCKE